MIDKKIFLTDAYAIPVYFSEKNLIVLAKLMRYRNAIFEFKTAFTR